jgi:hypothetical protein
MLILILLGAIPWIVFFPLLLSGTLTLLGFGSVFFLVTGVIGFGVLTLECSEWILERLKKHKKRKKCRKKKH